MGPRPQTCPPLLTYPAYPDATSGVRASLRSCPANLRSKISNRDEDEDVEDDGHCDPESPDYDEDADDCEDERDVCSACGQPIRNEEDEAERQAHLDLILRRLRS